ncbi:hypothetical protein NMG60_11000526 [Bertholletia excelsa]
MLKQLLSPLPLLLILLSHHSAALAQSPTQAPAAQPPVAQPPVQPALSSPPQPLVAPGPTASGPPNITDILIKARHFDTFVRLLMSTQMDSFITKKLNDSSQSLTIFAPDDNAFANLKAGSLNSYNDQKKIQLIKFHMISSFLSVPSGFQTASNPMSTEAGSNIDYPLNVTTTGNIVNVTSGVVNTTIVATVYTDNQLAVYKVDRVLLPLFFFQSHSPAPAPSKPAGKKAPAALAPSVSTASDDGDAGSSVRPSGANRMVHRSLTAVSIAGSLIAVLCL